MCLSKTLTSFTYTERTEFLLTAGICTETQLRLALRQDAETAASLTLLWYLDLHLDALHIPLLQLRDLKH